MNYWEIVLGSLGGATMALGAVVFLSKALVGHVFAMDIERYKSDLKTESDRDIERYKSDLKQENDRDIERYKSDLKQENDRDIERYKSDLNKDLENYKSQLQESLQVTAQIALSRLPSYKSLWALMEIVSPSKKVHLAEEHKREFEHTLTSWYYKDGNGIFLSVKAGDLFLKAKALLQEGSSTTDDTIRKAFSTLRTQMKTDVSVYGPGEDSIQIGV